MSEKPKKKLRPRARWRATNGYFRFGLFATLFVVAAIFVISLGPDKDAGLPRWEAFWFSSSNEIGDTIAGVASTLAFLWIIVTVMIQGNELRLQRRELAMTRRDLKAQVEATRDMATSQQGQLAALILQSKALEEATKIQVDEWLREDIRRRIKLIRQMVGRGCSGTNWKITDRDEVISLYSESMTSSQSDETYLYYFSNVAEERHFDLRQLLDFEVSLVKPFFPFQFNEALNQISLLEKSVGGDFAALRERVDVQTIWSLKGVLNRLVSDADLWREVQQ